MNRILKVYLVCLLFLTFDPLLSQERKDHSNNFRENFDEIKATFEKVKKICDSDNGKLWGENLWCPILVYYPETRQIIANEQDSLRSFTENNGVYLSHFPDTLMHANTTLFFSGKHWAMVCQPLPQPESKKKELFLHEMFHTYQEKVGLTPSYDNKHIDKMDARIWLKLEWNALEKAILFDSIRNQSIIDAIVFRNYRRSLFDDVSLSENSFEIHEGLADFTAYKLCYTNTDTLTKELANRKRVLWNQTHYKRVFGYLSGMLYGFLLEKTKYKWREEISLESDLGKILQEKMSVKIPAKISDSIRIKKAKIYGYDSIYQFELNQKYSNDSIRNIVIDLFIKQPVIKFDLNDASFQINSLPFQIDTIGSFYPSIKIVSKFGRITVKKGGCLLNSHDKVAFVPYHKYSVNKNERQSKDWTIKLNPGWEVIKKDSIYLITRINKK
jgi:hypothetical protein